MDARAGVISSRPAPHPRPGGGLSDSGGLLKVVSGVHLVLLVPIVVHALVVCVDLERSPRQARPRVIDQTQMMSELVNEVILVPAGTELYHGGPYRAPVHNSLIPPSGRAPQRNLLDDEPAAFDGLPELGGGEVVVEDLPCAFRRVLGHQEDNLPAGALDALAVAVEPRHHGC